MDEQSQVFRALAEPNRRIILDKLLEEEQSVGQLTELLGISQPSVTQHLQLLRDAGLVSGRKDGRQRIYQIEADRLTLVASWLSKYEKFWDDKFEALKTLLNRKKN